VVRYFFIVMDLHHLLLAGLPAHSALTPKADIDLRAAVCRRPAARTAAVFRKPQVSGRQKIEPDQRTIHGIGHVPKPFVFRTGFDDMMRA
jgi:hypothetical protein